MFENIYGGKKVLITGHTGVKATWLALWLNHLGAEVYGIGHKPKKGLTHYDVLKSAGYDLYALDAQTDLCLVQSLKDLEPDVVFHLAAKAIVARTFEEPEVTFRDNIMGTVHFLEMCRTCPSIKGIVAVTSDKVYANREWNYAYRENDTLGGDDPYSTSKVCIEHIVKCYRQSYDMNIATARAGNILCGGDWSEKRLIPDIVKATANDELVQIHTPDATRPFQHVLDALQGYLLLGQKILEGVDVNRSWNFGPNGGEMSVREVLETAEEAWPAVRWQADNEPTHKFMVYLLKLDSTESRKLLGWRPVWDMKKAVEIAIQWYRRFYQFAGVTSLENIQQYTEDYENGEV